MAIPRFYSLLFLFPLLISCSEGKTAEQNETQIPIAEASSSTLVSVSSAEQKPFEMLVKVPGKVEAKSEIQVLARTFGFIKKVHVSNGDDVTAGQLILELENDEQNLELEKSAVVLEEKRISYEDLTISFKNINDPMNREKILNNIKITSGYALAEVNYKQAEQALEKTRVKSLIRGRVSALKVKEFNPIKEGDLVAIIYDPRSLTVRCEVSELDALRLRKGNPAEIKPIGTEQTFKGSVLQIDTRVNEETGLVDMIISLEQSNGFMPGMSVQVTAKAQANTRSLSVPKEAVVIKSGKPVVFTEDGGLAKWNYVTLGQDNGKEVEVLSGLTGDKKVIISNNLQLSNDSPVKVVSSEPN